MLRQLTGIFILFAFLLVKGNTLFAEGVAEKITITQESQESSDEPADDEKESKNMEFADEFLHHTCFFILPLVPSKKLIHTDVHHNFLVHLPVWGPPPNSAVFHNA